MLSSLTVIGPSIPTYSCYFLNDQDEIQPCESIEAGRPRDAIERALLMLKARPQHHGIEVWQGGRRLYPAVYGKVLPKAGRRSSAPL